MQTNNPLLMPYGVPPMDVIKTEHFEPAIDKAIEQAGLLLAQLKADTSPASFDNTVVALETLFIGIENIQAILGTYTNAQYSDELIAADERIAKKMSAFEKSVFQDKELAARFQAIAPTMQAPERSDDDRVLYKNLSHAFVSDGAYVSPEAQARISAIDEELIELTSSFMDNLNKGTKQQAVLFTDPADMAGLPDSIISGLRENAQEAGHSSGWLVIPERLQVDMLLEIADSRNFRQKIFEALSRVGTQPPYDNEPIIKDIQALRHERATMLGYSDHAAYALSQTMAGSVPRAQEYMAEVAKKALPKFEETVRLCQAFAASNGGPRSLEPWDVPYWGSRYRKESYHFDASKFSEYLPLDKVVDGFFKTSQRIFDITFTENKTHPTYHPDVRTYDVTSNKTGKLLGIVYADFFARDHKEGGAWMSQLQQESPGHPSIVTLNMNLLKPEAGQSSLLSIDDMSTLFHEGGHALHGLLGTQTKHASIQGTAGPSDYIEFFSTVMENWPSQKEVLDSFAAHHITGEPLPQALFEAMKSSETFMSERHALLVVQNAQRDFAFHTMTPQDYKDSKTLETEADLTHPLSSHIRSYPLNRWSHLFSEPLSDYAACYYGYLWSQGLAAKGFKPFAEKGAFDTQASEKLARIYSYGSSRDMDQAFAELQGEPLTTQALANALIESIGADKPPRVSAGPTARSVTG